MSEPDPKDVAEALAITFEREDAAGAPWCPPRDAQALTRWVTDRSRELGGAIRRAVRLARLAAAADGRDYVRFLYVAVPTLRARHFSATLAAAAADGRLSRTVATLDASGVRLHEPAMRPPSAADEAGFEIDFVQMPRLAALIDVLHNALGYAAVADLLRPIVGRGPAGQHADEVARAIQSAFNSWLAARLESPHYVRQAQRIRAFLAGRGRVEPEAITDASILSFWTAMADASRDEDVEGFRLYTSAARALLRYRQALLDAAGARGLAAPLRIGTGRYDSDVDIERLDPIALDALEWQSPLVALSSAPADPVKWLTKTERLALANYLGGPPDDDGDSSGEDAGGPDPEKAISSLAGADRLDLRFAGTLLRADVFGAAQASLIAQLRRRVPAATAIDQALAAIGATAYGDRVTAYAALRDQMQLEALAALHILLEARCVEAVILMSRLGGRNAVAGLLPAGAGANGESDNEPSTGIPASGRGFSADADLVEVAHDRIATTLQAALAQPERLPPGATALIAQARAAIRKVNRQGFRPQDRSDAGMLAAMRAAVTPLVDLLDELGRLTDQLKATVAAVDVMSDREIFAATFQQLYGKGAQL